MEKKFLITKFNTFLNEDIYSELDPYGEDNWFEIDPNFNENDRIILAENGYSIKKWSPYEKTMDDDKEKAIKSIRIKNTFLIKNIRCQITIKVSEAENLYMAHLYFYFDKIFGVSGMNIEKIGDNNLQNLILKIDTFIKNYKIK